MEVIDASRGVEKSIGLTVANVDTGQQKTCGPEHSYDHGILSDVRVVSELLCEVYVNDVPAMRLICTPGDIPALVLGRLLSEGMISSTADVRYLYVCENALNVRVELEPSADRRNKAGGTDNTGAEDGRLQADISGLVITPTCCTGNRNLTDYFFDGGEPEHLEAVCWESAWISRMAEAFSEELPLHAETGGAHCAFLMLGGEIIFRTEDIGRHNALDKAIGHAMLENIPLNKTALFTSGRMPTDMAGKVIRAGVPLLAGKKSATAEAVQMAKKYGLTLIGNVRKDGFLVYNSAFDNPVV